MTVQQGDQYALPITIRMGDGYVTPDTVAGTSYGLWADTEYEYIAIYSS